MREVLACTLPGGRSDLGAPTVIHRSRFRGALNIILVGCVPASPRPPCPTWARGLKRGYTVLSRVSALRRRRFVGG